MYLEIIVESIILYVSLAGIFFYLLPRPIASRNFLILLLLSILSVLSLYILFRNEDFIFSVQFVIIKLSKLISAFYLYFKAFGAYKQYLESIREKRLDLLSPHNKIEIREGLKEIETKDKIANPKKSDNRYQKSSIPIQEQAQIRKKIEHFFENNEGKYLDSEFNLDSLSEHAHVPKHAISQTFSLSMNTTFNQFLNDRRINYACNELMNNSEISIVELSEMCGYKSRASFYRNFNIVKGISFVEYKKQFKHN